MAETVFKLLLKYRPEDKAAKKARLLAEVRSRCRPPARPAQHGTHAAWTTPVHESFNVLILGALILYRASTIYRALANQTLHGHA